MSTLATQQTATTTTTWNIDPAHSVAEFKVKHMMISNVKGQFPKVSGALTLDESNLANSRVEALIEAASIETRAPDAGIISLNTATLWVRPPGAGCCVNAAGWFLRTPSRKTCRT